MPHAPDPFLAQHLRDDFRLAAEGDLGCGHLRRHDGHEVVRAEHAVHQMDEGFLNPMASLHRHVGDIQEEHENPIAGVGRHRLTPGNRVCLDTHGLRAGRADHDVLEGLDLLQGAILEYLELLGAEILDGLSASCRVDVHPNVVCLRPESRGLRGLL